MEIFSEILHSSISKDYCLQVKRFLQVLLAGRTSINFIEYGTFYELKALETGD